MAVSYTHLDVYKRQVVIVLVAAALAAFVYFYDLKHTKPSSTPGDIDADASGSGEDNTKAAFTFTPSDVATMTICLLYTSRCV